MVLRLAPGPGGASVLNPQGPGDISDARAALRSKEGSLVRSGLGRGALENQPPRRPPRTGQQGPRLPLDFLLVSIHHADNKPRKTITQARPQRLSGVSVILNQPQVQVHVTMSRGSVIPTQLQV